MLMQQNRAGNDLKGDVVVEQQAEILYHPNLINRHKP